MSPTRPVMSIVCVAAGLMLASCVVVTDKTPAAPPQPTDAAPQIRGAESGKRQLFASFAAVNPDCTTMGYPILKVVKPPDHGQIWIEQGTVFPNYDKDNVRSVCNGKAAPATVVYYQSDADFTGSDTVAFDRIGVAGAFGHHAYIINVR